MAKTIKTYVGEAGRTIYPVDFNMGYLDKSDIYVYSGDDYNVQLSYTWVNSTQIQLAEPFALGGTFYIRRIVTRDNTTNDYEDGAILRESNLDDSFKQALMILEEIEDGFISESPFELKGDLDMTGGRIINLRTPIDDNEPVIKEQLDKLYVDLNTYASESILAAALAAGSANVGGITSGELARKYGEFVSVTDYDSLADAMTSGNKAFFWPNQTFNLSEPLFIPAGCIMFFLNTTLTGHFNDFLLKFNFPGESVLMGKLKLIDNHVSVVNSEATLTNGIQFGDLSNAIHGVDTSALDVYSEKLKTAYYFGEYSYSNTYGVLRTYKCGQSTVDAVIFNSDVGLISANDTFIKKLEITNDNTPDWNGAGLLLLGGYGVTFGQLHLESIYNSNAAQFSNCNVNILSGYFESVGAMLTSCTVKVNEGATVTINGTLINSPLIFNTKVRLVGCRFFNTYLHKNAVYTNCNFPNSNQLVLDVSGLRPDEYPVFEGGSSPVSFENFSGTWQEFGDGYTGAVEDLPFFGGDHALSIVNDFTTLPPSGKFTKITAGSGYMGASGFKLPRLPVGTRLYTWSIIKIPSSNGVGRVRFGVGGILGSALSDINSITTITKADHSDKWMLIVQPKVIPLTGALLSNEFYVFFEAATEVQNSEFVIDSFGVETNGLTYKNLFDTVNWKSYQLKRTSPPSNGTWTVGTRCINSVPTVGQPKAWVCTASPNTWVSEGNL